MASPMGGVPIATMTSVQELCDNLQRLEVSASSMLIAGTLMGGGGVGWLVIIAWLFAGGKV